MDDLQIRCEKCQSTDVKVRVFVMDLRTYQQKGLTGAWWGLIVVSLMVVFLGFFLVYNSGGNFPIPFILGIWLAFGCIFTYFAIVISKQTKQTEYECQCQNCDYIWDLEVVPRKARLKLEWREELPPPPDLSPILLYGVLAGVISSFLYPLIFFLNNSASPLGAPLTFAPAAVVVLLGLLVRKKGATHRVAFFSGVIAGTLFGIAAAVSNVVEKNAGVNIDLSTWPYGVLLCSGVGGLCSLFGIWVVGLLYLFGALIKNTQIGITIFLARRRQNETKHADRTVSPPSPSLAILLTSRKSRGYVTAGSAAIVGLIAFFLPYVRYGFGDLGFGDWLSGYALSRWVWFEEMGALVVLVLSMVSIFRDNNGPASLRVERSIQYGRSGMIGGGVVALLIHLLYLFFFLGESRFSSSLSISLGFGYWLFLLAAIAMIVGGVQAQQERAFLRILLFILLYGVFASIAAALLLLLILFKALWHL